MKVNPTFWIRKHPLTLILATAICILSLITPPSTPLDKVELADKWAHLLMYGTLAGTAVFEHRYSKYVLRTAIVCFLCATLLGGVMELLQAWCTTDRSGEWMDFVANALGAALGVTCGIGLTKVLR